MKSNGIILYSSICIIVSLAINVLAQEQPVETQIITLTKLRGEAYSQERAKILANQNNSQNLTAIAKSVMDWRVKLVTQALILEKDDQSRWAKIHENWMCGSFGPIKRLAPRQLGLFFSKRQYAMLLAQSFGIEAFPLLAEELLFLGRIRRDVAMEALLLTRNPGITEVLIATMQAEAATAEMRANAVWRLGRCLKGLPRLVLQMDDTGTGIPPPDDLRGLMEKRDLPEFILDEKARIAVMNAVQQRFESDVDEQVRALCVDILWQFGKTTTKTIFAALNNDTSPWVRAWCATSLLAIGGDEALKAIEVVKKTEKNAEVLLVLEGKAKPFAPWDGIPKNSILQKSNDTPSNAP